MANLLPSAITVRVSACLRIRWKSKLTETGGDSDKNESGENQEGDQAGDGAGEEVVMKTQEGVDVEDDRVVVNVSHRALADGLHPMENTMTEIKSQAQDSKGGPRKPSENFFKDVTNKLDPKPVIGKATRILVRGMTGQKRPSGVWRKEDLNGLPNKSSFEK